MGSGGGGWEWVLAGGVEGECGCTEQKRCWVLVWAKASGKQRYEEEDL